MLGEGRRGKRFLGAASCRLAVDTSNFVEYFHEIFVVIEMGAEKIVVSEWKILNFHDGVVSENLPRGTKMV